MRLSRKNERSRMSRDEDDALKNSNMLRGRGTQEGTEV